MAYRTTPHATTGVSPADMLYGRKVRTKLPEIREVELDSEVRDGDNEMKIRGKLYSDKRRGAVERDIHVGDEVLLAQKKTNKLSTPYSPDPYKIIERSGNSVKVQSIEGVQRHRNVSQMKKYLAPPIRPPRPETKVELEIPVETEVQEPQVVTGAPPSPVKPIERPSRSKRVPSRYEDFFNDLRDSRGLVVKRLGVRSLAVLPNL